MSESDRPDTSAIPLRDVRLLLEGWQSAGITDLPRVELPPAPAAQPTASPAEPRIAPPQAEAIAVPPSSSTPTPSPSSLVAGILVNGADKTAQLTQLAQCVADCRRCPELASTRTQTVFGVGDPQAKIMFIGEAPGADEDQQGEPFVGRAGQLLNKIIAACGLTREEIYICNILRCRPPGNRNPSDDEARNCREFLDGQITIVGPEYIVCWGSVAARNLLGGDAPIGKMRGKFYEYEGAKVLCTYHPSYLLRNPSAKKDVWEDMQFLFRDMGIELKG